LNVATKTTTTVALDSARRHSAGGRRHLFGAPGTEIADIDPSLLDGALGALVLVDTAASKILESSTPRRADVPYVTPQHVPPAPPSTTGGAARTHCAAAGPAVVHLDARQLESAKTGLIALVADITPGR